MLRRILGLVAAAAVGTWTVNTLRALSRIAPELRSARLPVSFAWVPMRVVPVLRSRMRREVPLPDGVTAERRRVTSAAGRSVDVLVYDDGRGRAPAGALLWIHGGGHLVGDPDMDHALCGRFVLEAGIRVVSVDYRLAPEDPFPADLDDCHAALSWLQENAAGLGVDPARIGVGGASAGGGLAAATVHRAHDHGQPVAFQLLEYPMLDDRTGAGRDGRGRFVWNARMNRRAWAAYLGDADEAVLAEAAPARRRDLSGLPPTWIGVGDQDLFHDEDLAHARRLRAAGVPCTVHVEPGMYHGADANMVDAPSMRAFRGRMVDAAREALGGAALSPLRTGGR